MGTERYDTAGGAKEKVANLNTEKVYKHAVFIPGTKVKNQKAFRCLRLIHTQGTALLTRFDRVPTMSCRLISGL